MRLIDDKQHNAFYNMALDEAICTAVRQKISPPTLRFYSWDKPSLSLGYFQKISDIDIDYCNTQGFTVVRRLTGGRAILHDDEITYSFCAPSDHEAFSGSLMDNYRRISHALLAGITGQGINARAVYNGIRHRRPGNPSCFQSVSYGEITVDGRKIIGSAQKRYTNGFLQHGSVMLSFDPVKLALATGETNYNIFPDIGALRDFVPEISAGKLRQEFKKSFEKELQVRFITDNPSRYEKRLAESLIKDKYSSRDWTFRR